jgi:DNA mismatch endonuclease, patch repair protein
MPDVVRPEVRSRMMSGIRGKNTKPEMLLRRALHRDGFRYRLHEKALPGRPDLVFPKYRATVFVNGCFWHGHEGCKYFKLPATRAEFWSSKIAANKARDARIREQLVDQGWRTAVVWECATRHSMVDAVAGLEAWLVTDSPRLDIAWG